MSTKVEYARRVKKEKREKCLKPTDAMVNAGGWEDVDLVKSKRSRV